MTAADTAFILTCTGLVFIMTPGLAFFYGGLLRKKNMINMMAMCFVSIAIVSVIWYFAGYSLAFAPDMGRFHRRFKLFWLAWSRHGPKCNLFC